MSSKWVLPALCAFALAACQRDAAPPATTGDAAAGDATPLPKPTPTGGPVTGMPDKPGPGPVGPPAASTTAEPMLSPDALPADTTDSGAAANPAEATATTPAAPVATPVAPGPVAEPSIDDAVAVVRGYFAALAGRDFARAHAAWSEGDTAHAAAQLAAEQVDVASSDVSIGAPGRLDAAAGSRYIRVPVTVVRSLRDGSTQRLAGAVTLRRAVVDGATAEQRAWHIAGVDLRPTPVPSPAQ